LLRAIENGSDGLERAKTQVGRSGFTLAQNDTGAERKTDAAARTAAISTKE
jgi:hypothetical protein